MNKDRTVELSAKVVHQLQQAAVLLTLRLSAQYGFGFDHHSIVALVYNEIRLIAGARQPGFYFNLPASLSEELVQVDFETDREVRVV